MSGRHYPARTDWWVYLHSIPAPRIIVLEDIDRRPGLGSCAGEVHAHIYKALGCVGLVTNGGVRDLPAVESLGFCFFAGNVAVSRAYCHMFDFGLPVELDNLKVQPGDLLHGDRHGVVSIPPSIARDIPAAAARVSELERQVMKITDSPNFSMDELRDAVQRTVEERKYRLF